MHAHLSTKVTCFYFLQKKGREEMVGRERGRRFHRFTDIYRCYILGEKKKGRGDLLHQPPQNSEFVTWDSL
jgi:hypothetical protein